MPLNMNATPSRKPTQRQLIPAGQHMARIVQIVDFGLQAQKPFQGQEKKPAYELYITFEFPTERIEIDGESRPMWNSKRLKLSSNEKSTCYKWYQKLDPSNKYRGDWSKLIGTSCAVLVTHDQGKGKNAGITYDNVSDVMPLMKGMTCPPLENDPVLFDLGSPDLEVFNKMPEWMQNIIKENLEFDGSKFQTLLEGRSPKWTARAEGDAPSWAESDDDLKIDMPKTTKVPVEDDDAPW